MILSTPDLITSLQNEVRILLHLASKIDRAKLDYRPSPKQRSTIELLKYLSIMGPGLVEAAKAGSFDRARWTAVEQTAAARGFAAEHLDLAGEVGVGHAGQQSRVGVGMRRNRGERLIEVARGAFIVNLVLCGCAAYRTQLFLYLKAQGRDELSTMNLWGGVDAPAS